MDSGLALWAPRNDAGHGTPGQGGGVIFGYPHHIWHNYQACTASAWPGTADVVFGKDPFDRD